MASEETSRDISELRLSFMDLVAKEMARLRRRGGHLSLVCVGLNDLEQVNLEHGRSTCDLITSEAAAALKRNCREEDYFWRRGGDEFVVVLTETGCRDAVVFAKRLAREINFATDFAAVPISASIGCSTYPNHGENVQDLFAGARAAMSSARSKGRGIVQIAQETGGSTVDCSNSPGFADSGKKEDNPENITVIISSPSPLVLSGMRQALEGANDIEVIGEIRSYERLPQTVGEISPDLVFADLNMAAADDFAIIKQIEAQNMTGKVAILVAKVDQAAVRLAADFSVDGIFQLTDSPEEIMTGFREIFQGHTVLPLEVHSALDELRRKRVVLSDLSEREIEVLRLVAEGMKNAQISSKLFITVNTVRFHLANIYQKLGVSNRNEAANYYLRQDLGPGGQMKML